MAVDYNPRVVTDGLVLALDAGNTKSYPGSGTTWTDLSRIRANGTLTNGPTFSSNNGGTLVFDGTDDYISMGKSFISTGEIATGDSNYTLESWFKYSGTPGTTTSGWSIIGNASNTGIGMQLMTLSSVVKMNFGYRSNSNFYSTQALSADTWYHVVCTRVAGSTPSNRIYINGRVDQTNIGNLAVDSTGAEMQIGWASGRITGRYQGNIAVVRLYNTFLTEQQVLQNYNALKGRYA